MIVRAELKRVFSSKMFWGISLLMLFSYLISAEDEFRYLFGIGCFSDGTWQEKQLQMAGYDGGIIAFFLPMAAVMPHVLSYRKERDSGYRTLMTLRASGKAYRGAKLLAAAVSGAGVACIPFLCWLPVSFLMGNGRSDSGSSVWSMIQSELLPLQERQTVLVLLYLGNQMLVAAAFALFSLGVTAVVRNRWLSVLAPLAFCFMTELAVDNHLARRLGSLGWNGLVMPILGNRALPFSHESVYLLLLLSLGIGLFLGGDRYAEKA